MDPSKAQLELMQAWNDHHEQLTFGQHEISTKLIAWVNEIAELHQRPDPITDFVRLVLSESGKLRRALDT